MLPPLIAVVPPALVVKLASAVPAAPTASPNVVVPVVLTVNPNGLPVPVPLSTLAKLMLPTAVEATVTFAPSVTGPL